MLEPVLLTKNSKRLLLKKKNKFLSRNFNKNNNTLAKLIQRSEKLNIYKSLSSIVEILITKIKLP